MNLNSTKVLFIYFNARMKRINSNQVSPSEFFYGYEYFKNLKYDVSVLEFDGTSIKYLTSFLSLFQKVFLKLFKFQYDFAGIFKKGNFKKIISNDVVIITNNRIAHSVLPALVYMKIKKINCKVYVIAMGMFNSPKNLVLKKIHLFLNSFLLRYVNGLIFIGKKEYQFALKEFSKFKNKIEFIPFGVDDHFWNPNDYLNQTLKPIVFIGNDSNRDFDFLIELIKTTPEEQFIVVTEHFEDNFLNNLNLKNATFYKGSWNKEILTDEFIKEIYARSKLTIVPLKNSIQPSGQSVSLQSISMNTPVIITKTDGFWDTEYFKDKKNIYFVNNNSVKEWQNAITNVSENKEFYKTLCLNGKKLITEEFNVTKFSENLHSLINQE